MAEMETLAEAVRAEFRRPEHGCDGTPKGCEDTCPVPLYEVLTPDGLADAAATVALSWLASVLADDATVEVVARAVRADPETCFDDEHCEPCTRTLVVALAALSAHLTTETALTAKRARSADMEARVRALAESWEQVHTTAYQAHATALRALLDAAPAHLAAPGPAGDPSGEEGSRG